MKRYTVSVPKDLKDEMDMFPDVNWPEIAKTAVLNKLKQLQKFDELVRKGEL
jgi:hypothetical protein